MIQLIMQLIQVFLVISLSFSSFLIAEIPTIQRKLPPKGIEIPLKEKQAHLKKLKTYQAQLKEFRNHPHYADVNIFFKSVDLFLEHGELYKKKDLKGVDQVLELGKARLDELKSQSKLSWTTQKGLLVRGFTSEMDNSTQLYGLEIPESLNLDHKVPLIVWLHGRGDKITDYHFLNQRLNKAGRFKFENAITLHPFGRQCIGYKHLGEVDVFEAIEHVKNQYKIDDDRIALMGFSMGGAGTYHIGAHYPDQFCAVHTGAGFVETAKYNKLTPETYPPKIEQTLWQMYDVPNYVRNFSNTPIIAYCGDQDSKIPWIQLMQDAFKQHSLVLPTIVGKDIGHKYTPESLVEIQGFVSKAIKEGLNQFPTEVRLQTPTLKYSKNFWVQATGLNQHWSESRIDAKVINDHSISCKTRGIQSFQLSSAWKHKSFQKDDQIKIDQQEISVPKDMKTIHFIKNNNSWYIAESPKGLLKRPQRQGPMDDAYMSKFIVVTPDQASTNPTLQRWLDFEIERLRKRWKALYRAKLPECSASELTQEQIKTHNLILWGTPETNAWIAKTIQYTPLTWDEKNLSLQSNSYDAKHHVPSMIYPNPLNNHQTYILYNSAPSFREGHDRTNSLQNPKLGDYAVFDLRQYPDAYFAGKVVESGFFNESWK